MMRASLKPSTVPMKRSGFLRTQTREVGAVGRLKKAMTSRGMKGRTPTADEQRFMSAIASLGCLACAKDGISNPWISLHHIDGHKAQFEARYGTQYELLAEAKSKLGLA